MPVASMYRSTHLEMQLLSLPLRLEPGFVIHFSKHFPLTVCKMEGNWNVKCNYAKQNTEQYQYTIIPYVVLDLCQYSTTTAEYVGFLQSYPS